MADKIVYSSESGDARERGKKKAAPSSPPGIKNDGVVRVRRESKGRGGKTVTAVYGLPLTGERLASFATSLKQKCGAGGTVKDGAVMIQGDRVDQIMRLLEEAGHRVKKMGG